MNDAEFKSTLDALLQARQQLVQEAPPAHTHAIKSIDAFLERPDPLHIEAIAKFIIQNTRDVSGGAVERLRMAIDPKAGA